MYFRESYSAALSFLDETGRSMDESTSQVVPLELFQVLDGMLATSSGAVTTNPEWYETKLLQDAASKADQLRARANYLQVVYVH
jgi:hypothetical protein